MTTPKVLFIDDVHVSLPDRLESLGYSCEMGIDWDRQQVLEALPGYHGAVIRSRFRFDRELVDAASQLQFIARPGSGLENIEVAYAESKGIRVFNSPEGNRDAVGEQAVGMLLMLFNNLMRADREVRAGIWQREANRGIELKGKTVGIYGYGNMGGALARRLSGFGVRVIAYDKYKTGFTDRWATECSLEQLYAEAEIVSLHLPLNAETKGLANQQFFNCFHHPITLINTARGPIVPIADLVEALESGQVAGACLDVLEFESTSFEQISREGFPPAFQQLILNEQVVLSPHIAGWTHASYRKMSSFLADKVDVAFGLRNTE